MEPTLDEASLIPCERTLPADRVRALAATLKRLDEVGAPRVLRSVRDAADRDLGLGRGLRVWCFDGQTPRDAGRFLASRLTRAPYVDGPDGLFAQAEGERVIAPTIGSVTSLGGGQVALTEGVLVLLKGASWPPQKPVQVRLEVLTQEDQWEDLVTVLAVDSREEVERDHGEIARRIAASVANGAALLQRLGELCPRLVLGERAAEQIGAMNGSEPFFPQVLRHLRALDLAAERRRAGTPFEPEGVTFSVESGATLSHGSFGPMRDFPTPAGFDGQRWTLHTKLTGGNGARLYYKAQDIEVAPEAAGAEARTAFRVAIGYVGPHLPTMRHSS